MNNLQKGFSLVEVLLASTLLGVFFTILVGFLFFGQESALTSGDRERAVSLADEGLEAVRNIRDANFSNLTDGTYGVALQSNNWALSGNSSTIDGFTRSVQISTLDSQTKIATSSVTWSQQQKRSGSVSVTTRLTNWMAAVAQGWASASLDSSFNLTVANSTHDTADVLSVFTQGNYAYIGRSNSTGREFIILDISNPASPTIVGQRDLNGNPNDIVVVGNYAYVSSSDNSQELQIIDISTPSTIANAGKLTAVDLTVGNSNNANADAVALATDGSYLFMGRQAGDKLIVFNLATATAPTVVGRLTTVLGIPSDIASSGNIVYLTSDDDTQELQVVNVATKTSPSKVGSLNLNNGDNTANALSVAVYGTTVYVGRNVSATAPELYKISVTNPALPALTASLDLGNNAAMAISLNDTGTTAFVATSDIAADLKIVDTAAFSSILATVNTANVMLDTAYNSTLTRLILGGSDDTSEVQIVKQ